MSKRYGKHHRKHPYRNHGKKVSQPVVHLNITLSPNQQPRFTMTQAVYDQIMKTIGSRHAEQGGAMGVNEQGCITTFFYDASARAGSAVYYPNVNAVQNCMRLWAQNGVHLKGFIHSHPTGMDHPSEGDRVYAQQILSAMPRTFHGVMYMPIVQADPRRGLHYLRSYAAISDGHSTRIVKADLFVGNHYYDEDEAARRFRLGEYYHPSEHTAVPTLARGDLVVQLDAPHLPPESQNDPACVAALLRRCADQLDGGVPSTQPIAFPACGM